MVTKTCFSEEKLIKQYAPTPPPPPPRFLREPLLSTNPLFLNNFFITLLFVQILKIRTLPPNFRGCGVVVWAGGVGWGGNYEHG